MPSKTKPKKTTDQDRAVGARLAELRVAHGLSQTAVATSIGVSFQQVQKYEKGTNRIGAGRLQAIADALGVHVSVFFAADPPAGTGDAGVLPLLRVDGAASLLRAYASIEDEGLRKDVLALVRSAAKLCADRTGGSLAA